MRTPLTNIATLFFLSILLTNIRPGVADPENAVKQDDTIEHVTTKDRGELNDQSNQAEAGYAAAEKSVFYAPTSACTATLNSFASNPTKGLNIYELQRALDGMLDLYQATRDPDCLTQSIAWADKVFEGAVASDTLTATTGQPPDFLGWSNLLTEAQWTSSVLRLACILADNPYGPSNTALAQKYYDWIARNFAFKWNRNIQYDLGNSVTALAWNQHPVIEPYASQRRFSDRMALVIRAGYLLQKLKDKLQVAGPLPEASVILKCPISTRYRTSSPQHGRRSILAIHPSDSLVAT